MKGLSVSILITIVVGALSATASAENMRCGNDYISINDSAFTVVKKCGEPVSKIHVGYTVDGNQKRELIIEEWIYGPHKNFFYFITITGGRVTEIRSERQ